MVIVFMKHIGQWQTTTTRGLWVWRSARRTASSAWFQKNTFVASEPASSLLRPAWRIRTLALCIKEGYWKSAKEPTSLSMKNWCLSLYILILMMPKVSFLRAGRGQSTHIERMDRSSVTELVSVEGRLASELSSAWEALITSLCS